MRHVVPFALLLLMAAPVLAEKDPLPVAKGNRLLGIHVSEAADGDFGRAYAAAKSAGMEVAGLSVAWDEIEKKPGQYASKWLPIANAFYGPERMRLSLVIKTLDTVRNRFPEDLRKRAFDDPLVIARFQAFLTWMFTQIPDVRLMSLSLGNEVDGVLGADAKAWAAYTRLFNAARKHVRKLRPSLPVSVTTIYDGLVGPTRSFAKQLYEQADIVLLTYYPLDKDVRIRPVAHLHEVFRRVTALYPNKPIHFGEIGCPSSPVLGSSLEHQARFIDAMFEAWDRHAARVPHVAYCWLTDTSDESLELYQKYYGSRNPRFVAYLATLGLRHREGAGKDKPAFVRLRQAARARGFPGRP